MKSFVCSSEHLFGSIITASLCLVTGSGPRDGGLVDQRQPPSSPSPDMPSSALPLKVPSTPAKNGENDKDKTPMATSKQSPAVKSGTLVPGDISSPHELTVFVSIASNRVHQSS